MTVVQAATDQVLLSAVERVPEGALGVSFAADPDNLTTGDVGQQHKADCSYFLHGNLLIPLNHITENPSPGVISTIFTFLASGVLTSVTIWEIQVLRTEAQS